MIVLKKSTLVFLFILLFASTASAEYIFELAFEYDLPDGWANGCATGDFNYDGYPDVAASLLNNDEEAYFCVLLGSGNCEFDLTTPVFLGYPVGSITTGDFNDDGNDDLLLGEGYAEMWTEPNEGDQIHLLDSNGDGTFTELTPLDQENVWVTSGDINDDGECDLITASFGGSFKPDTIHVYLGNGDFTFQEAVNYAAGSNILHTVQILGDMNQDGTTDIGYLSDSGSIQFHYGNGDGTFQLPVTVINYFSCGPNYCFIESGDFSEDGVADFAATGGLMMASDDIVWRWNGYEYTPSDTLSFYPCAGNMIDTEDFDLDGHLDVAVSWEDGTAVLPGLGDGTFQSEQDSLLFYYDNSLAYSPFFISEDMDLDGDQDLVIFGLEAADCVVYRNTTITLGVEGESSSALSPSSMDVFPNPFSSSVTVSVSGADIDFGCLQVFDLSGRMVSELEPVSEESGSVYSWNGRSSSGRKLPPGVYTVRLSWGSEFACETLLKLE